MAVKYTEFSSKPVSKFNEYKVWCIQTLHILRFVEFENSSFASASISDNKLFSYAMTSDWNAQSFQMTTMSLAVIHRFNAFTEPNNLHRNAYVFAVTPEFFCVVPVHAYTT